MKRGFSTDLYILATISSWDDDVVFKNQARGTDDKRKKEFVNVCISWSFPFFLEMCFPSSPSRTRSLDRS